MSELYDQVAALDKGIADRWKAQTGDNPKHELTADDINAIVSPLFKRKKQKGEYTITHQQAEAIVKLAQTTSFGKGGVDRLKYWVQLADGQDSLEMHAVASDAELAPIFSAVAMANSILFVSPGSRIGYGAHQYMVIAQLIRDRKILVYKADIGQLQNLTAIRGRYQTDSNKLYLYIDQGDPKFKPTVVHEATHAIQDWLDVPMRNHFSEADAWIAQMSVTDDRDFDDKFVDTAFAASRIVRDRKAILTNKDWQKAYDAAVKAYDAAHDDGWQMKTNTQAGESENAQYDKILDAIEAAANPCDEY
jgi:hypothetical protein